MPRSLPFFLLALLSALPSFALSVGPEMALSPGAIEPAPFRREQPRVASNGDGFLAVWVDHRTPFAQVRGTRVDRDGNPLDAESLWIAPASTAAVASDGRDYVVAHDRALSHVDAASGAVTPGSTIDVIGAAWLAIASNGSGYLVAYTRNSRIEAVEVDADASLAGAPFFVMNGRASAAIASNGDAYLIVGNQGRDLNATLVSGGKVVRDQLLADPARTKTFSGYAVASDGDGFLVAWRELDELRVARVDANGVASPARTILTANATQPAVTWTGAHYLVSYSLDGDVRGIEVNAAGEPGAPIDVAAGPGLHGAGTGATSGAETLLVWTNELRFDAVHVEGRLLDAPAPRILSTGAPWQDSTAAGRRGSRTVFAWEEIAGAAQLHRVMLQRLDARGLPLDGRGIPVAASARHQRRPALAGSLIAWVDEDPLHTNASRTAVWAKLLDAAGVPYGEAFEVGEAQYGSSLAMAAAGNAHLVVWQRGARIVAARIDPYAQTRSAPFFLSSGPGDNFVDVATDGSGFLVTWQRDRYDGISCIPGCTPPRSLHAAAVTHWGVPVGPESEVAPRGDHFTPMVVWNGSQYAVFWTELEDGTMMRTVRRGGIVTGATRVAAANQWLRALRWTGAEYRLLLTGESNALVLLDRDLRVVDSVAVDTYAWGSPVLTDRYVAYVVAGNDVLPPRAVVRAVQ